jgi:hypothetical protein
MFKKGYTYTSGNQGLCSIKDLAGMPACLGKECLNRDAQGCAPINSLYTFFVTENTTVSDVKATMLSCGYPNVYDGNRNYEENELAEKENCMYKNGFNYRAGSGHIRLCEIPSKKNKLTACSPYKSSENIKNLECGIAGALADQSSGTCNNTAHF